MPWRGPEYEGEFPSLGWSLLGWSHDHLPSPSDETQPLILTPEQATILVCWYALDPETGEFLDRRGALEMPKGWGKSPFAGVLGIAELAGPVVFDGWDARGEPVGRPWGTKELPPPWVQIAAVSEDQTENTYAALYEMLTANEGRAARDLRIDEGRTRLYLIGRRGRLEPVTASAGSREGQRITFAVLDETQLWLPSNGGVKLASTIRRNAAKMGGRTFDTMNAPELGEQSVAETSEQAGPGVYYYAKRPSVEPSIDWTDEQMLAGLAEVYGDARWIDQRRLLAEIRDPETTWEDAERYYFNHRAGAPDHFLPTGAWEACRVSPHEVEDGAYITLGFSGSGDRTGAALIGIADGYLFVIECWEGKGVVSPAAVDAAVAAAMAKWNVEQLVCNPPGFDAQVESWGDAYGVPPVVPFEVRKRAQYTQACGELKTAVLTKALTHDGDPRMVRHMQNARPKAAPEGQYIVDGPGGAATLVKAAVVGWSLAGEPAGEPMVAWV